MQIANSVQFGFSFNGILTMQRAFSKLFKHPILHFSLLIINYSLTSLFSGCTVEQIEINPSENTPSTFLEGRIQFEGKPLANYPFTIAGVGCTTDSTGYYRITGLNNKTARLQLQHNLYRNLDTLVPLTVSSKADIQLRLRSDSFFPLSIGSTWKYTGTKNYTVTITGKVNAAGKDWIKAEYMDLQDSNRVTEYYRQSGDTVYQFQFDCGTSAILCIMKVTTSFSFSYKTCDPLGNWPIVGTMSKSGTDVIIASNYKINTLTPESTYRFERGIGITRFEKTSANTSRLESFTIAY
ncbi:MAG: hypothetical protein HYV28_11215 [Ignavibacteriales bacterium]|nr:hypothetical protein [Ignavibacteriales bacterium]